MKATYELGGRDRPVSLSALADALNIAQASAGEMVRRLVGQGLVTYEPYHGVTLTAAGALQALLVTRRHRLWERFLTDYLELSWDRVHREACRLEHATSPLVEERLAHFLGQPQSCPHGHPVPSPEGQVATVITRPLSNLEPGQAGVVQSVAEEPALLQYLGDLGLVPRAEIQVEAVAPFEGPLTVRVGSDQRVLGREVASQIQVCLV